MRKPERHFNVVWWFVLVNALALFVLGVLELFAGLGIAAWLRADLKTWGHGIFWAFAAAELAAGGVRAGQSGTMTAWVYYRLAKYRTLRILLGTVLGVTAWYWIPTLFHVPFGWIFGVFLTLWLPPHYSERGFRGIMDRVIGWIEGLT